MIAQKDYLKLIMDMSETEKKDYIQRVKRWDEESLPKLMALYDSWERVPVKDFDEGLRIASALMSARTFIPVARQFTVNEALKYLNGYIADVRKRTGLAKMQGRPANDPTRYKAIVPEKGQPQEDGTLKRREYKPEEVDGRRPEHLSDYIHLLPDYLKGKAAGMGDMYLELAEYRGRLEVLSEHPDADKEMIAEFATKTVNTEQAIRSLWTEIDEAYDYAVKHGGDPKPKAVDYQQTLKQPGAYTKEEIEAMADPAQREHCKKMRIESNKKYLRRKDGKPTQAYKDELALRIKEMMAWGIEIQPAAYARCKEIGLVVPGFNDENKESEESGTKDEESAKEAEHPILFNEEEED